MRAWSGMGLWWIPWSDSASHNVALIPNAVDAGVQGQRAQSLPSGNFSLVGQVDSETVFKKSDGGSESIQHTMEEVGLDLSLDENMGIIQQTSRKQCYRQRTKQKQRHWGVRVWWVPGIRLCGWGMEWRVGDVLWYKTGEIEKVLIVKGHEGSRRHADRDKKAP